MARSNGLNFKQATALIGTVCEVAGSRNIIQEARSELRQAGVIQAVREHDDRVIFNWLMQAVSYQGIADSVATSYMESHGTASAGWIEEILEWPPPRCDKLHSFWKFKGCGYRKTEQTCRVPKLLKTCPVPKLDLRNGSLSQAAFSLHLFMRDVAGGDFVQWIDQRLNQTSTAGRTHGASLIEPLSQVHGLSSKVLNMSLATLLLGADSKRTLWRNVGADFIVIDSLVHAWLHRSGILRGLKAEHQYGPACYLNGHCEDIIRWISTDIDARAFNSSYPEFFPRFIQSAVWRFCAKDHFNQCNGNRINDSGRCWQTTCILYDNCARLKLGRQTTAPRT